MPRRLATVLLALAALAIPAAPAAASVADGYSAPGGAEQTQVQGVASSDAGSSGSQLPFTGLDVGLMLAGGVVLLGGGVLLGRVARSRPDRT